MFPNKINLVPHSEGKINGCLSIGDFFRYCVEDDTIYVRLDDDIVWLEDNFFQNFLDERIKSREYFLVFSLIINNAICTHLLYVNDKIKYHQYIKANAYDEIAWKNNEFVYTLHKWFIKKVKNRDLSDIKLSYYPIALNRFSINCISWFGEDFKKFDGIIVGDEEEYLTVIKPAQLGKVNLIVGNCIVSHFAFYTQREFLDKTDILSEYEYILLKNSKFSDIFEKVCEYKDFGIDENEFNLLNLNKNFSLFKKIRSIIANFKIPLPSIKFIKIKDLYYLFFKKNYF
ncbi:MAG: hypothetical protein N2Z20_00945 [Elusimicrobiales bacterium]|nr:hypothetical protein [Elusimicrobiales bacterium]